MTCLESSPETSVRRPRPRRRWCGTAGWRRSSVSTLSRDGPAGLVPDITWAAAARSLPTGRPDVDCHRPDGRRPCPTAAPEAGHHNAVTDAAGRLGSRPDAAGTDAGPDCTCQARMGPPRGGSIWSEGSLKGTMGGARDAEVPMVRCCLLASEEGKACDWV